MRLLPRSLFARTSVLIACTLVAFSMLIWQASMWAIVVPSAKTMSELLVQRARTTIVAYRNGGELPEGARLETGSPQAVLEGLRGPAYGVYVKNLSAEIRRQLHSPQVVISRIGAPMEIWVRVPEIPDRWIVLSIRLARPEAPLAVLVVIAIAAALVLSVSAWSARRLARPLSRLAAAAADLSEGRRVAVDTRSGPQEVRAVAVAFDSMTQRMTELGEQRELLMAGVSHELRSPLARIRVAAELLDARDAELAQSIATEVEDMDRMIEVFLRFVRSGYIETPTEVVPDEVARTALAAYAEDARVRLEYQASTAVLMAANTLRHCVQNLVRNALEYGAPPVIVTVTHASNSVTLTVSDAGPGIAPAEWEEALRPFERLRSTPAVGHSGLGLALVARLISASGGTLKGAHRDGRFAVIAELPVSLSKSTNG
jgi:two-component system, OmpR family, osmolarity sensor histidine kinase EnvZ